MEPGSFGMGRGRGRGRITSAELFLPRIFGKKSVVNVLDNTVREKQGPVETASQSTSEMVENPVSSSSGITSTGQSVGTSPTSKDDPRAGTAIQSCAEASSREIEPNPATAAQASTVVKLKTTPVSCAERPAESHDAESSLPSRTKTLKNSHPKKVDSAVGVGPDVLNSSKKKISNRKSMKRVKAWVESNAKHLNADDGSPPTKDDGGKKSLPEANIGGTSSPSNLTMTPLTTDSAKFKGCSSVCETVSSQLQSHLYQPLPEDIPPSPKGFQGVLVKGESWRYCPYYEGHTYLKSNVHLVNCRNRYIAECEQKGKAVDIEICRFDYDHHVHINRLEEHESNCNKKAMRNTSNLQYMKNKRVVVAMDP